ncbi:MAG: AMP-binding protein, partial [Bacteroidota bacterium]
LPKAQLAEVIALSDLKMIFLGKLDAWGDKGEAIPEGVQAIKFPHYQGNAKITMGDSWDDLLKIHEPATDRYVPNLDDLWTIKFTSGTTGTPKGVMHNFGMPALVIENEKRTNWIGLAELDEVTFMSYLPLNHVGERIGVETSAIAFGGTISFAERLETFVYNMQETQPTFFFSVPRIWNKFYLGVVGKIPKKRLDVLLKIPLIGSFLKNKIRTGLGLRNVEVAATGAAITPAFLKDFYRQLGIHLVEAYGMTEVGGSFTNSPDMNTPSDSVGKVVPFAEIKIDPDTSEILMKTPYVMMGYYKNPELTAKVLRDGWLHSGDKGSVDANGFVRVTGRVSDTFKTSKGKYITPNPSEEALLQNDFIEQVCVVGIGIPQPIALVNLSDIAKEASRTEVEQSLQDDLAQLNVPLPNYARISTIVILEEVWSEANKLLTPTLKVIRGHIDDSFRENYLSWHEMEEEVVWG